MGVYLMGTLYVVAELLHFIKPKFFLQIMPPYVPAHQLMVVLSGIAEVVLGLALFFPVSRTWAAWGIVVLLIAVFPANLYMAYDPRFQAVSPFTRWGRLPLQAILIWWAIQYTR